MRLSRVLSKGGRILVAGRHTATILGRYGQISKQNVRLPPAKKWGICEKIWAFIVTARAERGYYFGTEESTKLKDTRHATKSDKIEPPGAEPHRPPQAAEIVAKACGGGRERPRRAGRLATGPGLLQLRRLAGGTVGRVGAESTSGSRHGSDFVHSFRARPAQHQRNRGSGAALLLDPDRPAGTYESRQTDRALPRSRRRPRGARIANTFGTFAGAALPLGPANVHRTYPDGTGGGRSCANQATSGTADRNVPRRGTAAPPNAKKFR